MPEDATPSVPAGLRHAWRPAAAGACGLALTALATVWLGPVALLGAGLLAVGAALGALSARRQVRGELARLMASTLVQAAQPRQAVLPSDPPLAATPLLQPLADGLSQLLMRQQMLFDVQAEQLESLRQQAHSDPLTGLPNRRFFTATLDAMLSGEGAPDEAGLLLLRVCDLQGMNQRIGHAATDHVLQALAQAMRSYPSRIERCCAGRLNGADFALLLPVGGMAVETAASLVQALRLPILRIDPSARVAAGGVELRSPINATQALALADAALARNESGGAEGPLPAAPPPEGDEAELAQGESSWQRRIGRALVQGRVALGAYPVCTADGRQLHLDCPLRVQLVADGPMEPAARWLALATRSRLCAAVDEKALVLALEAIARDGVARCINIAGQSVASAEFVAAVSRRLEAEPALACRLWIDLPESLALERPLLVREVSRRWRPLGVMLGLEHAGEGLARIPRLIDLGFDCVRIDSRYVNGIAAEGADDARRYLQGLVKLVQTMGLQVSAEGVRSADDLEALWRLGFDAATGPALAADSALAA
jgi:diguanylate cyclase (GGDEF)-like protein